jgi:hypothetical protein
MCRPQFGRYFPLTLRYLRWPKARPCAAARSRQSPNGRSRPANVMGEGSSSPTSRVMSPPGRLHTSSRITDLLGAAGEQEKSRRLGHRVQVIIQLGSRSDGLSIASSTLSKTTGAIRLLHSSATSNSCRPESDSIAELPMKQTNRSPRYL